MSRNDRIIVAISGASGAIYSLRLIKAALESGTDVELVVSDYGKRLLIEESELNLKTESIESWLDRTWGEAERPGQLRQHAIYDLGSSLASGTQEWIGMAVVPSSMKTLAGIAHGTASNLIERAADVTLKEGRRLVIVPRETPFNLIHLENMTRAARAGAHIVPAMPAFYQKPKTFEDLADFIAGRVLSLLGIRHALVEPWKG